MKLCPVCNTIHSRVTHCPPHREAWLRGRADRDAGLPFDETTWPQGVYGCASYALGYYSRDFDYVEPAAVARQAGQLELF